MLSILCRIFASEVSALATRRFLVQKDFSNPPKPTRSPAAPPPSIASDVVITSPLSPTLRLVELRRALLPRIAFPVGERKLDFDGVAEFPLNMPCTVSTAFWPSTTSVRPSEHRMHAPTCARSSSVTTGSALTHFFIPALPKARDTARMPAVRCTPLKRISTQHKHKNKTSVQLKVFQAIAVCKVKDERSTGLVAVYRSKSLRFKTMPSTFRTTPPRRKMRARSSGTFGRWSTD